MTDTAQRAQPQHASPAWEAPRVAPGPPAPAPASTSIHRARRPAAAAIIAIGTGVLALPAVRLLLAGAFGPTVSPSGIVSGSLMLLALPLAGLGLYGLATGAAGVPDLSPSRAWLRPPVAYLPAALVLFVAAGLAAS